MEEVQKLNCDIDVEYEESELEKIEKELEGEENDFDEEDDYLPEPSPTHKYGKVELSSAVSKRLRQEGVRKEVSVPKQIFHISDDSGDIKDFYVKGKDGVVSYNAQDISKILDALMDTVLDILKEGGSISLRGFCTLELCKHKGRTVKHPQTREPIWIDEHYSPKFSVGQALITSANIYTRENRKPHVLTPDEEEQPVLPVDKIRELEEEGIAVLDF